MNVRVRVKDSATTIARATGKADDDDNNDDVDFDRCQRDKTYVKETQVCSSLLRYTFLVKYYSES